MLRIVAPFRFLAFGVVAFSACSTGESRLDEEEGECRRCWTDADRDGYAVDGADSSEVCGTPCSDGFTERAPAAGARDCNDTDRETYPGAPERCNGASDNCDSVIDEGAAATCSLANAVSQCTAGQCTIGSCQNGYGDCSTSAAGCEQALNVAAHCGDCNRACPGLSTCQGELGSARCQCAPTAFETPPAGESFGCSNEGPLIVGDNYVCALKADRSVACWGVAGPPASARFVRIAGAPLGTRACGITVAGTIQCWPGTITPPPPSGTYEAVAVDVNICGIGADGRATCTGPTTERYAPNTKPYRQIGANFTHHCAVARDGTVSCWGLGKESDTSICATNYECGQSIPLTGAFAQVAVGGVHTCGLRPSGQVECWGAGKGPTQGTYPEWGQGRPPAQPFRYITAHVNVTCGIRIADNAIECWGEPYQNAGGSQVSPPSGEFPRVAAGLGFACGLTTAGDIQCWGNLGSGATAIPASITGPFPLVR